MNISNNIFSIDLEDWYHSYYSGIPITTNKFRIEKPTTEILKLLKQTKNYATFFVVGDIAKRHPELIKEISLQGHEIASHSFHHNFIYNMSKTQFKTDTVQSKEILETLIHQKIIGYRAPAWSVDLYKTPWFWEILKESGFKYSSSVFPFHTFLYGDNKAPRFQNIIDEILEIPPSTHQILQKRLPFSGGFYLRSLPFFVIKYLSSKIIKQEQPVVFYIHPREIDLNQPRISLPLKERFIHYYNIPNTLAKLTKILHNFSTTSFKKYYNY